MALLVAVTLATSLTPQVERPDGGRDWEPLPTAAEWDGSVEYWRPLVELYWQPEDVDWALLIIDCESEGDPAADNPNSSARGLFQIMGSVWADYFGVSYDDLYDPAINVRLAAEIRTIQGTSAWVCTA